MAYEWDPAKAKANLRKHGVDFADAVGVLEDPLALTTDDPFPSERRFLSLGLDLLHRFIVVNWTWRGENIRLISARKATRAERRDYQEGNSDA
jgi:uncharacterized DUF497 family protein